jgi:LacI family transcriptional regulator
MSPSSQNHPTLKDVARRAGLSSSTISAALLNHHRIAARTRERVQLLAREMGYVRNSMAAALAASKTKPVDAFRVAILSHVLPSERNGVENRGDAMRSRLAELGYESDYCDLGVRGISLGKLRDMFYHRGYRGVVFDMMRNRNSELFTVDWTPFCLVSAGRTYYQPPFDVIRDNPFKAVSVVWREARKAGYERIGFLLCRHDPPMLDDMDREASLWACQQSLTSKECAIPPYLGNHGNAPQIRKWLHRHRPDVVVGFNETHYHMLREMGWQIPQDVAYANLIGSNGERKFAEINSGEVEMRTKCAEHLDFLVRYRRTGFPARPWDMTIEPIWQPGESLPA